MRNSVLPCGNSRLRGLLLMLLLCLPALPSLAQGPMSIIELVDLDKKVQPARLQRLCRLKGYTDVNIYYWHRSPSPFGYLVAYGPKARMKQLLPLVKQAYFPLVDFYDAPFYKFDRHYCADKTTAKQWDNILLMATLVKDPAKQQEYLSHHATQFQQWPEVAQGFCNASFQQLLVFRQERRLMLVISIPKGDSLARLNPKTSENNPRVDEWNALMKQYQQGLDGTEPGETWVVATPIVAEKPVPAKK
ncbi:L-rhamnose mutarotase [Hymenobacter sp. BT662]|uniref:L-rhamnose mutarotase n=2 Tax=Hymenobacter ruricola TaxID=2791023 RepID=A0ABS0I2R6_9BACT|nr:L-rhamnose mutarotase [Hymenobacter ruricola]